MYQAESTETESEDIKSMGAKLQSSMEMKMASLKNLQIAIPSTSLPNTSGMIVAVYISPLLCHIAQSAGCDNNIELS